MERNDERYKLGDKVTLNPLVGYSKKQCETVWIVDEVRTLIMTVRHQTEGICMTKPISHFVPVKEGGNQ